MYSYLPAMVFFHHLRGGSNRRLVRNVNLQQLNASWKASGLQILHGYIALIDRSTA
jgi:hypothetical protein